MAGPDGKAWHTYGLLDDYFIIDLTLDGFALPDGRKGPRIVALPEWSPFVQQTYRYFEDDTADINEQVTAGRMYHPYAKWRDDGLFGYRVRWSSFWRARERMRRRPGIDVRV
ncbi:MAG: hypothetical protein C4547_11230 [Phycisphaerales bacterium]|nr:MAG: hypothetical protein C4547_11230 [Phycisphaerales bacterium]